MREGERARIHVPAALGYGSSPQGSKVICSLHSFSFALIYCHTLKIGLPHAIHSCAFQGGAWYIPGNSNLLFDIEILHRAGKSKPEPADL